MEINYRSENSGHEDSGTVGEFYQDFVKDIIWEKLGIKIEYYITQKDQYNKGESLQGWEIKYDQHCGKYYSQGVSIEIAEKTKAENLEWVPSGIYRQDNTLIYVQGNEKLIYIFAKRILQLLHLSKRYKEREPKHTIKIFYLPYKDADKYCSKK